MGFSMRVRNKYMPKVPVVMELLNIGYAAEREEMGEFTIPYLRNSDGLDWLHRYICKPKRDSRCIHDISHRTSRLLGVDGPEKLQRYLLPGR